MSRNSEHAAAGYIGSASMLEAVKKVVQRLRERNPDLTYGARHCWSCGFSADVPPCYHVCRHRALLHVQMRGVHPVDALDQPVEQIPPLILPRRSN